VEARVADNNTQQVDSDDGLLFFHTHSLWEVLNAVEKFYECKIYGVLDLQEVEEHLKLYDEKYSSTSKQMILEGMEYAYNKVESCYEYEIYLEKVQEYIDTHTALAEDDAYE
tara:strand:+ start:71 stop:406 length:336 start_codon:yes stop_codon:yes gene_type:complete